MIPYLDLNKVNEKYKEVFFEEFNGFLSKGTFVLGSEIESFESQYAKYCGTRYCIGVANGLDALSLTLKAYIDLGFLEKGDEVIVPANTFVATLLSVVHAGLIPVFVEPDPHSYNISIGSLKRAYTTKVKAIVVVHLYGQLVDIESIRNFAISKQILLIEDAAQAHGAISKSGKKAGNLGNAAAFSFYPSKNLGALGDAGAITTNDKSLADKLRSLRNYGSTIKYQYDDLGVNSRLDSIQALFLKIKLDSLDEINKQRQELAHRYLSSINNSKIKLPVVAQIASHVFYAFVIRVENRNDFLSYLSRHKIGYHIHYPIPPHKQKAFSDYKDLYLPITEEVHKSVVSIPLNETLTEMEIKTIINVLNDY